jgi:hypothetical protein
MKKVSQMTYEEKLKHPLWQKKRLEILNRDKWKCKLCKDSETTLHVHHIDYESKSNPWDVSSKNLVTLCQHCHHEVEILKDENEFDKIIIEKINWDSGNYTMMIYAGSLHSISYKIYKSNGVLVHSFSFNEYTQETHIQFFKRCKKLDSKIEYELYQNQLLKSEINELAKTF